jgi:hypothetical protein
MFGHFGILLSYALGSVMSWRNVAGVSIIIPILGFVNILFVSTGIFKIFNWYQNIKLILNHLDKRSFDRL